MNRSRAGLGQVLFTGAGPGDPELLTVAASNAIKNADLLLYSGSLVSEAIVALAKPEASRRNSAVLTFEECIGLMIDGARKGQLIVRLHSGDPSLFGTIAEQIEALENAQIPWRVIPGITAAMAAAASAGISLTLPEVAQGLIIARQAGRTRTPQKENLASLAAHQMPMAIYLSGSLASEVQTELLMHLSESTPVLCAHKVGWKSGRLVWTELANLASCVEKERLEEQTVFIVVPQRLAAKKSRLYAGDFSHKYREGKYLKFDK